MIINLFQLARKIFLIKVRHHIFGVVVLLFFRHPIFVQNLDLGIGDNWLKVDNESINRNLFFIVKFIIRNFLDTELFFNKESEIIIDALLIAIPVF